MSYGIDPRYLVLNPPPIGGVTMPPSYDGPPIDPNTHHPLYNANQSTPGALYLVQQGYNYPYFSCMPLCPGGFVQGFHYPVRTLQQMFPVAGHGSETRISSPGPISGGSPGVIPVDKDQSSGPVRRSPRHKPSTPHAKKVPSKKTKTDGVKKNRWRWSEEDHYCRLKNEDGSLCLQRFAEPSYCFKHRDSNSHSPGRFQCPGCRRLFARCYTLQRHMDGRDDCLKAAGNPNTWGSNLSRFTLGPPSWQEDPTLLADLAVVKTLIKALETDT